MVNKNAFMSAMVLKGYNQQTLAKAICTSQSNLSMKIKGKRDFKCSEIKKLIEVLDIKDPMPVFFADEV